LLFVNNSVKNITEITREEIFNNLNVWMDVIHDDSKEYIDQKRKILTYQKEISVKLPIK